MTHMVDLIGIDYFCVLPVSDTPYLIGFGQVGFGQACRNRFTGVAEDLYESFGFRRTGNIQQCQGIVVEGSIHVAPTNVQIRKAVEAYYETLVRLDEKATGLKREPFIKALLAAGATLVSVENDNVVGFSICRPFGCGHLVGPVIGVNQHHARALIAPWLAAYSGKFLCIDVPADSHLAKWLDMRNLKNFDYLATMMRPGTRVEPPYHKRPLLFGLASQSLGG